MHNRTFKINKGRFNCRGLKKMTFFQTTEALPLSKKQNEVIIYFLVQIVIVSCSVIANGVAFFTVKANGVLTHKGGMPTLTTAALYVQEPEWTLGSKVTHDVT